MPKTIEFYFDFGSPTAYLAYKRLKQLEQQYSCVIEYKPVLLGALFKATNNVSPAMIPTKGKYMMMHDLPRFAKRYDVEFMMNQHFPINTLPLMRGAHAAIKMGCFDLYCEAIFSGIWQTGKDLGDKEVIAKVLEENSINANELLSLVQSSEIKESLLVLTQEAIDRELFGVPTLFLEGEMFFGQDRLDFLEERLMVSS
ncbi:disulfide bond formation protein DsbA [Gammaproteobacteria bacterium 42_54_T18]|nr:disulfide bond formation protein DsbA [Gammaproteobacteria bacterium 42_54_T18]